MALFLTGCSQKSEALMTYTGNDGKLNASIGTYVSPISADLLSKTVSVVMEDENAMIDSNITASSAFMINDTTGEVLFGSNVYERIYPASTTKLLTALMVLKYANLNDVVTVEKENAGVTVPGAKLCYFNAADSATMESMLNCLLVYSGNDAAIAIAEHMYGSEEAFVDALNE